MNIDLYITFDFCITMDELIESLMESAEEREGGLTLLNLFKVTVDYLLVDHFAGLTLELDGGSPNPEKLTDIVITTADNLRKLQPLFVTDDEFKDYTEEVKEDIEHYQLLYDKVTEFFGKKQ